LIEVNVPGHSLIDVEAAGYQCSLTSQEPNGAIAVVTAPSNKCTAEVDRQLFDVPLSHHGT